MALQIKNSMNGLAAIKKIGVKQVLYDWLAASNVEVKLTASEFKFIHPSGELDSVPVTLNQLQALNLGTLSPAQKVALQQQLALTIMKLMEPNAAGQAKVAEEFQTHTVATAAAPGTLDKLPPIATNAAPAQPAGKWPMFPQDQMLKAKPIKLREAVMMYQPVDGSSSGSRYFMVAASQDVRVGARLTHEQLSIRIEGPAWEKYAASISSLGFDTVNKSKGYASVHLSVGSELVAANKTLGAVLMGLGIPLETPIPNLKLIKVG